MQYIKIYQYVNKKLTLATMQLVSIVSLQNVNNENVKKSVLTDYNFL